MLCFNLKIAALFRAYREHRDESVRDRSQSVCSPPQRPVNRDIGALRVLQRRASSVISSATELISRRNILSRRNYSSVDQFHENDVDQNLRRFRLENGKSLEEKDEIFGSPNQILILENPEHQTRWYFKYFLGKLHQNYAGIDSEKNPYFLSIVLTDTGTNYMPLYRIILFRKQGTEKIALPYSTQKLSVKQILPHFPYMDINKVPKEIFSSDIQKDLLLLEEQEGSVNFKFGVVYMKNGQTVDDEILSNEKGSKHFDDFLNVLGEKIRLKGWKHYRGGLDVKGDMTGEYSIYTIYEGNQIMFHVSTLLPFSHENPQQVERKRHIGNDIVNIVFIDDENQISDNIKSNHNFIPNCMRSQFTHIFAVVSKYKDSYKLSVFCDENVPVFSPTLPTPPIFENPNAFREFLLVKLINGEKATFQTTTFSKKRERTLELLIKDLHEEFCHHDTKMTMINRRAFSEALNDVPKYLKDDTRQIEFIQIGQALKLEAIIRGDAPTSHQTSSLISSTATTILTSSITSTSSSSRSIFKRPPWEPQCFYTSFQFIGNSLVGDSFEENNLIIATDAGTFLIKDDQSNILIFDNTLCIKQLTIVEEHGILLLRGGSSIQKDSHRIHVFRLNDFKNVDEHKVRSKNDVKDMRLEKTKGCHLYTTSKGWDGHMRMAIAIGKRLLFFQWKHSAAYTSFCPENDNDTVEGFIYLRELTLHDSPTIMTILEAPSNGLKICAGFKYHFEIISEMSEHSTKLYDIENGKKDANLVTALDLCDGIETELLLCFDHTCHFQKLSDNSNTNNDFDFRWNTIPNSVVCGFPYIIAFSENSMEIRLLVNGNLVQTLTMIDLQLITSKRDIFFIASIPEYERIKITTNDEHNRTLSKSNSLNDGCHTSYINNKTYNKMKLMKKDSTNSQNQYKTLNIYKIPLTNLIGKHHSQVHNPHNCIPIPNSKTKSKKKI